MDDSRATDQMPQTIGRYQIQDSVGFGAMGAVYKAFDPLIKRTLAIKTIRLDIPRQSPQYKSFIERFYHEARISGTLSHPNIVTLFDIGEEGGLPYLAMEYVEGETIASMLDRGVKFKPERVIALVSQIASAMDYAHAKGVIHRDIKPSNLILFEGDKVKVTDFGIAKLADAEMTQSGTLLGTPSYMSPEQAMGEKLDGRSDIFSLGVCAFEMLSGEQPFPGSNVTAILYKLVHVDPIEPANLEMNGLVPQKWHEVFSRVLAKKPDDRYQTAGEFVQDLEYCLGAWFGSAMGDETISESASAQATTVAVPAFSGTGSPVPPPSAVAAPPAAAAPPAVPRSKQAGAKTLPPVPLGEGEAATVHLKAVPNPAPPAPVPPARRPDSDTGTVVFAPGTIPKPPAPRPAAPAAAAPPPIESTVAMKGSAAPVQDVTVKTPPQDVTLKQPAVAPTIRASAPTAAAMAAAGTAAAARPARPAPPPRATTTAPRPAVPPPPRPAAAPRHAAAAPAKKGAPMGLILGGAGLLVLAVVVGAGTYAYRKYAGSNTEPIEVHPSPPPTPVKRRTPPPAAAVATGTLHVESQPAGATILVDGVEQGTTPADLTGLTLGAHEVRLDLKGYASATQGVQLTAAAPGSQLKLALSKTAAPTGAAEISSDPSGATVRVDGAPVGQTPFSDARLKPGSHRVELAKEGFEPWSGTITVVAGKKARVDARLRAVFVAPPPTLADEGVDRNRIYVNAPPEVDTPAKKSAGTSAAYPGERAPRLKSGDSVSVRINFVVTETGEVTDLRVVESGGRVVDEAVLAAVRKWKYSPAVRKGTPVKVRVEFRQTFRAG